MKSENIKIRVADIKDIPVLRILYQELEEDEMSKGENSDEIWDVYDRNRMLTDKKHRRSDPMKTGEYHLVVHVCIFNSKNELLIQRRQPWKKGFPNMWDLTVGGSAVSGDDSQKAAERETREEIGLDIDLTGVRPHFTINFEHGFDDYYLITQDVDINKLSLQQEEVREVKWVDKTELLHMVDSGEMISYYFLDKIFDIKNQYGARVNEQQHNIEIKYAAMNNLASWMSLVEIVRWDFPGLETEELFDGYKATVIKNIKRGSAICAMDAGQVVGILLFSTKHNMLCCMAVHPEYRRKQIATKMINEMLKNLDRGKDIIVETFRADDPKGKAPRELYTKIGFIEGELITSMNNPNQRFILKPHV